MNYQRNRTYCCSKLGLFILLMLICQPAAICETPLLISQPDFANRIDQPTVSKIYRDSRNLLWIGTQQGLYRYDGAHLAHFNSKIGNPNYISHSDVRGISADVSGNLLVATFGGGLLRWKPDSEEFERVTVISDFEHTQLDFLSKTGDGTIWTGSKGSLLALDGLITRVLFSTENPKLNLNLQKVNGVLLLRKQSYLIASSDGLWLIDLKSGDSPSKINFDGNPGILSIGTNQDGSIILALSNGHVLKLDPDSLEVISEQLVLKNSVSTVSYISASENLYWIATDKGIYLLDDTLQLVQILDESNTGLSDNYVTSIFVDDDIYWVGTIFGLNILTQNHLEIYNHRQNGIHHEVLAFTIDDDSKLWVGTYDGLYTKDLDSNSHSRFRSSLGETLKDQRVMTLASKEDELWIGFRSRGVQVLNIRTGELSSFQTHILDRAEVTKILAAENSTTWIATYNQGLYRFSDLKFTHVDSIKDPSITILYETHNGEILAASESRFFVSIDKGLSFKEISLEYPESAKSPLLLSVVEHPSGDLFLGTKDQGIFSWRNFSTNLDSVSLERFGDDPDSQSATIYGMLIDNEGKLWASTQKGIAVLNPDGSMRLRLLKQDGLQANDFNFGAAFTDSMGAMYFGGVRGYNKLNPAKLVVDYSPPKLHLVSIKLPDKEYYIAGRDEIELLELDHSDYFITLAFSTLDFTSVGSAQYRYMLEGFDPQWIDNGSRKTATYTNLPPGEYTFKLEAANSAGVWSEESIEFRLHVLPPYWKTIWAYCVYFILGLLGIWGTKRAYDNHAIKERALKYAAEMTATADRAEDDLQEQQEVQDELVKASYKHNLALLELLRSDSGRLNDDGEVISRHIEVLTLLEECYCYQTDSLQADMNRFTNALLSRQLNTASVSAETINTVNSVTSQLIPAEIASPLALVMYELLQNSLQHAFTDPGSSGNFVEIGLDVSAPIGQESPTYELSVADNGAGFPAGALLNPDPSSGLGFVNYIVDRYDGRLSIDYDMGSRITFTLGNCPPDQGSIE